MAAKSTRSASEQALEIAMNAVLQHDHSGATIYRLAQSVVYPPKSTNDAPVLPNSLLPVIAHRDTEDASEEEEPRFNNSTSDAVDTSYPSKRPTASTPSAPAPKNKRQRPTRPRIAGRGGGVEQQDVGHGESKRGGDEYQGPLRDISDDKSSPNPLPWPPEAAQKHKPPSAPGSKTPAPDGRQAKRKTAKTQKRAREQAAGRVPMVVQEVES